jgi:hypothetical protein
MKEIGRVTESEVSAEVAAFIDSCESLRGLSER